MVNKKKKNKNPGQGRTHKNNWDNVMQKSDRPLETRFKTSSVT